MGKIRFYLSNALQIADNESLNPIWVIFKVVVANLVFAIGIKYFSYYGLARKPFSSYKGYMLKRELEPIQTRLNSAEGREIADNKFLFHQKCLNYGLPTPTIYGCLSSKKTTGFVASVPILRDAQHLLNVIENSGLDEFIFKPEAGYHGKGLTRFTVSAAKIYDGNKRLLDPTDFLNSLRSSSKSYLLQAALKPHRTLKSIMANGSLGTVRVVTTNRDGEVSVDMACVRIPVGKNVNDNFVSGQTGNLLGDIDLKSGILGNVFAPNPRNPLILVGVDKHPETGVKLNGFEFPMWDEIIKTARKAAQKFECLYTCGWDIALTESGPCLLETNWRYDIDLMQISAQRPLRAEVLENLGL